MLEENRVNDSEENNIFQFKRYTSLEFNQVWGCKKGNVQASKAQKLHLPDTLSQHVTGECSTRTTSK